MAVIAITGALILPVEGEPIEGGTILLEDGKIAALGQTVRVPRGAERDCAADTHSGASDTTSATMTPAIHLLQSCILSFLTFRRRQTPPTDAASVGPDRARERRESKSPSRKTEHILQSSRTSGR